MLSFFFFLSVCLSFFPLGDTAPFLSFLMSGLSHINDRLAARGEVVQLVERRTRRFDSSVRQGSFLPESAFSADSLTMSVHPRVQSQALTSVRTLKIL